MIFISKMETARLYREEGEMTLYLNKVIFKKRTKVHVGGREGRKAIRQRKYTRRM